MFTVLAPRDRGASLWYAAHSRLQNTDLNEAPRSPYLSQVRYHCQLLAETGCRELISLCDTLSTKFQGLAFVKGMSSASMVFTWGHHRAQKIHAWQGLAMHSPLQRQLRAPGDANTLSGISEHALEFVEEVLPTCTS